jgi:hypothetical protein
MQHIIELAVKELKEELDEPIDVATEPSRLMRFCLLKYKCFVIFLLACIAMMTLSYIMLKEILTDDEAAGIITKTFNLISSVYFPNATVSVDVVAALTE